MSENMKPEFVSPASSNMKPEFVSPANTGMKPEHAQKGAAIDREYYELLEKIKIVDFAHLELNMFHDTHPDDLKSMEKYNRLAKDRIQ